MLILGQGRKNWIVRLNKGNSCTLRLVILFFGLRPLNDLPSAQVPSLRLLMLPVSFSSHFMHFISHKSWTLISLNFLFSYDATTYILLLWMSLVDVPHGKVLDVFTMLSKFIITETSKTLVHTLTNIVWHWLTVTLDDLFTALGSVDYLLVKYSLLSQSIKWQYIGGFVQVFIGLNLSTAASIILCTQHALKCYSDLFF